MKQEVTPKVLPVAAGLTFWNHYQLSGARQAPSEWECGSDVCYITFPSRSSHCLRAACPFLWHYCEMAAALLVLSCYLKRTISVWHREAGNLKSDAFRKVFIRVKLDFTWFKRRGNAVLLLVRHMFMVSNWKTLSPHPELIIWFIKCVSCCGKWSSEASVENPTDASVGWSNSGAAGWKWWRIAGTRRLIGPSGVADHTQWMDTSPSPQIAAISPPHGGHMGR